MNYEEHYFNLIEMIKNHMVEVNKLQQEEIAKLKGEIAAMTVKPKVEFKRVPACLNCYKLMEENTIVCSKECAQEHEAHVLTSMATGN